MFAVSWYLCCRIRTSGRLKKSKHMWNDGGRYFKVFSEEQMTDDVVLIRRFSNHFPIMRREMKEYTCLLSRSNCDFFCSFAVLASVNSFLNAQLTDQSFVWIMMYWMGFNWAWRCSHAAVKISEREKQKHFCSKAIKRSSPSTTASRWPVDIFRE